MNFRNFVVDCHILELPTVGRSFAWTNGHMYSRIDKALVNATWQLNMSVRLVQVLDPLFSDHSLLCLAIEEAPDTRKRPFKLYNYLAQHSDSRNIVRDSWVIAGEGLRGIWKNLKTVRYALQKLSRHDFNGVTPRIQEIRAELQDKQRFMR